MSNTDTATKLLEEREGRALRWMAFAKIAFVTLVAVGIAPISGSIKEVFALLPIFVTIVCVQIVILRAERKGQRASWVGLLGTIADALMLCALPVIWHVVYSSDSKPLVHLLRHNFAAVSLAVIALNGLALRPLYPAILTVTVLLTYVVLAWVALGDPRLDQLSDGIEDALGVGNSALDVMLVTPFFIALAGALVTLAARAARTTVMEAAAREHSEQQLRERQIQIEQELEAGRAMQMDLMPKTAPEIDGFELAGICEPAREVGGDYYTYLEAIDGQGGGVSIILADVSGKGMQAATVAMRFNEMLRYEVERNTDLVEILKGLDRSLRGRIPPEMFATCGIATLQGRKATIASAAAPDVCHYDSSTRKVRTLGLTGFPIGLPLVIKDRELFQSRQIDLLQNDLLVFTSDGVDEAFNPDGDMYGSERLIAAVERCGNQNTSAQDVLDELVREVKAFTEGHPQSDDITIVVIRATA